MNLEEELSTEILNMLATNFDRWRPGGDTETVLALMDCADLMAKGIARKLAERMTQVSGELDEKRWEQMVEVATRDAFMEVTPEGPLVKVGKNPTFAKALAESTGAIVAPTGSAWAQALEAREEQRHRDYLKDWGCPPDLIEKLNRTSGPKPKDPPS